MVTSALVAYAVTGVVTDFMILIVPLVYVHRLLMDARSKRATSFVFLLGFMWVLSLSVQAHLREVGYRGVEAK